MDVSICVCDVYVYRVEFTVLNIFVNDVHLSANHDVVLRLVIDVLLLEVICVQLDSGSKFITQEIGLVVLVRI